MTANLAHKEHIQIKQASPTKPNAHSVYQENGQVKLASPQVNVNKDVQLEHFQPKPASLKKSYAKEDASLENILF